ncbi:MAG TPA: hypothetical protein VGH87_12115, partial [Polyangiaceae bacterium]
MEPPPAPRTPSTRARRLLFSYPPSHSMLAAMGVVSFIMGLFAFQVFGQKVPADVALTLFGSKTTGTIVSQDFDRRVSVDHMYPTRFEFRYAVAGSTLSGHSYALVVPPELAYTTKVDVEYLAFAPEDSRAVGTTRNEGGDSIGWFIAVMVAFGSSTLGVPWWMMRRKRRAFERGVVARGTITFVGDSSVAINGRNPKKIAWTFTDRRGASYGGALSALMSSDLPPFAEGDAVA